MQINMMEATNEAGSSAFRRPRVVESYSDYAPPFAVAPMVERMLDSVPVKYLNGLSEIVLTNATALTRKRRRSVTKSRARKVRVREARGVYHPEWNGSPPWIEIFVDNALKGWDKGWWLMLGFIREGRIGVVLFHEIGHHIDFTIRPEYRDKEDIADNWARTLGRNFSRKQHPYLRFFLRRLRPLLRLVFKIINQRLLEDGKITQAQYEKRIKDFS
jgi:hypothetical protein